MESSGETAAAAAESFDFEVKALEQFTFRDVTYRQGGKEILKDVSAVLSAGAFHVCGLLSFLPDLL